VNRVSRVVVTARAKREILRIAGWWTTERPQAPDLFHQELRAALVLLRSLPNCGRRCELPGLEGVRRFLLRRTGYHVYYEWDEDTRRIILRAVRHTSRRPTGDAPT
jgi:plasmid stabilization system protein ParE